MQSNESRPGGYSEAAESFGGDKVNDRANDAVLARIREQAARDPRKAARHEQRRQARRQRHFESAVEPAPSEPCSWGMTAIELIDYAAELRRQGWSDWEIRARLVDPRQVAA